MTDDAYFGKERDKSFYFSGNCTLYYTYFVTDPNQPDGPKFRITLDGSTIDYTVNSPVPSENTPGELENDHFKILIFTDGGSMFTETYFVVLKNKMFKYYPWKEVWRRAYICERM